MTTPRLAIAAGNPLNAEAAAEVGRLGGNAVDACLASAVMAWVAEPYFASLGGSGFVTVRTPEGQVEVFDGNNAMPYTEPEGPGQGMKRMYVPDYSDGMFTGIGPGSVGVPGILAAVHSAWEEHGQIEWAALFSAAIKAARDGFPFPRTSAFYLSVTHDQIWSVFTSSRALFAPGGTLLKEGDWLVQAELAESLELIAERGPDVFYRGEIASALTDEISREGGFLGLQDLDRYEAIKRSPISSEVFGWMIESNPPPATGGAVLVHMLAMLDRADMSDPERRLANIVEAQRAATGLRPERSDDPGDVAGAIEDATQGKRSGDTTHASTADADGFVCSLTESAGYGSGMVVNGIILNNALGEEELNPLGVHRLPPGSRCHSNMAPTVALGPDRIVGIGSPGADRITSAVAQVLLRLAIDGASPAEAVAGPRCHLDPREQGETLCFEPGLPGASLPYLLRPYDDTHMYFGGVQVATVTADGVVDAAHDPRRSGATLLV